jgi:hypothetical protein
MATAEMQLSGVEGLTIADRDGEPMMLDLELAQRLGYANPYKIRHLIQRLRQEGVIRDSDILSIVDKMPAREVDLAATCCSTSRQRWTSYSRAGRRLLAPSTSR